MSEQRGAARHESITIPSRWEVIGAAQIAVITLVTLGYTVPAVAAGPAPAWYLPLLPPWLVIAWLVWRMQASSVTVTGDEIAYCGPWVERSAPRAGVNLVAVAGWRIAIMAGERTVLAVPYGGFGPAGARAVADALSCPAHVPGAQAPRP